MARLACLLIPLVFCFTAGAQSVHPWALADNPHFEVYSQAGPENARTALAWFEQLRTWLIRETGLRPDRLRPARVIGFATPRNTAATASMLPQTLITSARRAATTS